MVFIACGNKKIKDSRSLEASEGVSLRAGQSCSEDSQAYRDWLFSFFSPSQNQAQIFASNMNLLWYEGGSLDKDIPVVALKRTHLSLYADQVTTYPIDKTVLYSKPDISIMDFPVLNSRQRGISSRQ